MKEALLNYLCGISAFVSAEAKANPNIRAKRFAWPWSYAAEAALIAHERTNDDRFLDWLVRDFEIISSLRDNRQNLTDTFKGRITSCWGDGALAFGHWTAHTSVTGRITTQPLEFARLVLGDRRRYVRYQDAAKGMRLGRH